MAGDPWVPATIPRNGLQESRALERSIDPSTRSAPESRGGVCGALFSGRGLSDSGKGLNAPVDSEIAAPHSDQEQGVTALKKA
jgi:hypothetical protein